MVAFHLFFTRKPPSSQRRLKQEPAKRYIEMGRSPSSSHYAPSCGSEIFAVRRETFTLFIRWQFILRY